MIPTKLKIIVGINFLLSVFMLLGTGLLVLINTGLISIIALLCFFGWIVMIVSMILLLLGKKLGFYLYVLAWLPNLPSISSVFGIALYIWMFLSISMITNDKNVREYVKINGSFYGAKEVKLNEQEKIAYNFISDSRLKGISDNDTKSRLVGQGYNQTIIQNCFKYLDYKYRIVE